MAVTAARVKELRERTGLGMMDCKKALEQSEGDLEKAIEELRKSSALKAAKKSARTTANGLLAVNVAADGSKGAMVEVNVETDFAAKNEKFIAFVARTTDLVFASADGDLSKILAAGLDAERETLVQEIGENISVRRAQLFTSANGGIACYLHSDHRKGALVKLSANAPQVGRDIAMHVTALGPMVVKSDDVPADVLASEREIYQSQAADSGKPDDIISKMVAGRVQKFLAEVSLVEQPFVKDNNQKVGALAKEAGAEILEFVRFEVGEGIDVEAADFAAEVAAQLQG